MKFSKSNWKNSRRHVEHRSPQRIAAAKRSVQKQKDAVALFPEMARDQTAEARLDRIDAENRAYGQRLRDHTAATWRRARATLRALPSITRQGILAHWQSQAYFPREAHYLADYIWQVMHRHKNPWRDMRILRQFSLVREGRLPRTVLQAIRAWD